LLSKSTSSVIPAEAGIEGSGHGKGFLVLRISEQIQRHTMNAWVQMLDSRLRGNDGAMRISCRF
jgi:hypothetical protein